MPKKISRNPVSSSLGISPSPSTATSLRPTLEKASIFKNLTSLEMPRGSATPRVSVNSEPCYENQEAQVNANAEEPDDEDEDGGSSHSGSDE